MHTNNHNVLKHLRNLALTGALVPLALAVSSGAQAGFSIPFERSSFVDGSTAPEAGQTRYSFEVFNRNDVPCLSESCLPTDIVDWELPLFSLAGISDITSPEGWDFELINVNGLVVAAGGAHDDSGGQSQYYNNPTGPYGEYLWNWSSSTTLSPGDPGYDPAYALNNGIYGPNPVQFENPDFILHWFTCAAGEASGFGCEQDGPMGAEIEPGNSLGGPFEDPTFSFLAVAAPTNVPYVASWFFEPPTAGDPPSPLSQTGIGVPNNAVTGVPEPGTLALMLSGLLGLFAFRRRRSLA